MTISWQPVSQITFVFHLGAWNVLLWPTLKDQEISLKMWFLHVCGNTGLSENGEPVFPHGDSWGWPRALQLAKLHALSQLPVCMRAICLLTGDPGLSPESGSPVVP